MAFSAIVIGFLAHRARRARRAAERDADLAQAALIELAAAARLKDEFLGTISHELRTPLNAILGWLHLIKTGSLDEETERRGFETIERNVRLQVQLTGDLLDASKALTGRLRLNVAPVSLKTALHEAVSQVSSAATAKDVTINLTDTPGPVVVRGDAIRLRQILWHLLANAIKFTPRGGSIDVTLESNDQACVTIRDSGPGIDREFLPHVFDRFTQADSSPTRAAAGLGVGLSLVRELVERHGGEVLVDNARTGGAIFTVRLPLHHDDQGQVTPAASAMSPAAGSPPLNGIRVLLLDQDRDVRELLGVALRQRGASVQLAGSVDQALPMLESWRPDVLVSDAASPEHDAYALVGKVQSLDSARGGRIPALALTRMEGTNQDMWRRLSEVKRDLPKPVEPSMLTAEIARMTGRERRLVQR